jgi:hypothetical protein
VRNATPVDKMGRTVPLKAHDDWRDRLKGQCALFFFFLLLIILIVLFFTFVRACLPHPHLLNPTPTVVHQPSGGISW